jgi:probable HAF family extracellular repeat protein
MEAKSHPCREEQMKTLLTSIAAGSLLAALAVAQPHYTVTDLGTLGGPGTTSNPLGVNAFGWAAGTSNLVANGPNHAFLWFGGGRLLDLGTLGGPECTTCNSQANGMNALAETAVGSETSSMDPNGEDFCGYGTHHQCRGAIGTAWGLAPLPLLPGGNNANAFDVNDLGRAVGVAENGTSDATCASGGQAFQALRFEAVSWGPGGRIQELQPLPGDTVGFATGINFKGQAVGASGLCSNTAYLTPFGPFAPHAVLWDSNGSPTDLGHLEGEPAGIYNIATSINDRGDVVGFACVGGDTNPATCIEDTFLWTKETGMQDLGRYPNSIATGPPCCHTINNHREIVGFSVDASGNELAIVWKGKTAVALNTLIPQNSGWNLECAQGINDAGEIVGFGTINGSVHAFRATPQY